VGQDDKVRTPADDLSGLDIALEQQRSIDKRQKKEVSKKKGTQGGKSLFSDTSPKIDITSGMNNLLMKRK